MTNAEEKQQIPCLPFFDPAALDALRDRAMEDEDLWRRLSPFLLEELSPTDFGAAWKDRADCPQRGLGILEGLAPAFGAREDVEIEGDLVIPSDAVDAAGVRRPAGPMVVHGDLRVSGGVVAKNHLLVTGAVFADTLETDYDHKVCILGDVETRAVATDGALFVGGEVRASELVWTFGDGWPMSAGKGCTTRIYINQNWHPDQLGPLVAEHQYEVPDEHDFDSLRAVFVDQTFDEDGELLYWQVMQRLRARQPVFRGAATGRPEEA